MGQYHIIVNLDKKESLSPHMLGSGLKAWEQLASGMTGKAMIVLMVCPIGRGGGDLGENEIMGRWRGDRVVIVGDYAEDSDFKVSEGDPKPSEIYGSEAYTDITDKVCAVIEKVYKNGNFIIAGYPSMTAPLQWKVTKDRSHAKLIPYDHFNRVVTPVE